MAIPDTAHEILKKKTEHIVKVFWGWGRGKALAFQHSYQLKMFSDKNESSTDFCISKSSSPEGEPWSNTLLALYTMSSLF